MNNLKNDMRITVNNHTVSYTDEGKKEDRVIIFIHGFPFNKSMWSAQVEALKDNYRVITYDVRGHGGSDSGNRDFLIELFVKDLLAFMDALKIDKTTLCGLSMGGYIALNAIQNYPERFDALILSDTQCTADTPEAKEKRSKAIKNIINNGREEYADETIKNLFASVSFTTKKEQVAAVREMMVNTSEKNLCKTLLALSVRKETCSNLPQIKVPVLIMVGKEDKITPLETARFMHEKIEKSFLCIIDQAGHLSNMENSMEFNYQLKKFLLLIK